MNEMTNLDYSFGKNPTEILATFPRLKKYLKIPGMYATYIFMAKLGSLPTYENIPKKISACVTCFCSKLVCVTFFCDIASVYDMLYDKVVRV